MEGETPSLRKCVAVQVRSFLEGGRLALQKFRPCETHAPSNGRRFLWFAASEGLVQVRAASIRFFMR